MNEEILTLYETYFRNFGNYKLYIKDLSIHNCCFCSHKINVKHCKTDMSQIILEYLNHLKLFCYPWEKIKYFFKSIKISGFLDDNCLGKWTMVRWVEKDVYILIQID